MKKFNIKHFSVNKDGNYEVWFGNRICVVFKSKRDMGYFLADTNRFLTRSLIELNELFKQTFIEYRNTWFLMQNVIHGPKSNYSDMERKIKAALRDVDDMFERIGNTFSGTNDPAWAFIHIQKLCRFLGDAVGMITEVNKNRNNTIAVYNLSNTADRLKAIHEKIGQYPGELPAKAIEMKNNN